MAPRCHHPHRLGNRLYVSYWHHGLFILDIEDMSRPKHIAGVNTSPTFPHPTHTCLPFPHTLKGRRIMVVADEDVAKLWPSPPAFAWIYDITDERCPIPISTIHVDGVDKDGSPQPDMTGCHQPSDRFTGDVVPFAWFAHGLRLVDVADPFAPREVGRYVPDPPEGHARRLLQRCHRGRPRPPLPDRPPARCRHHRDRRVLTRCLWGRAVASGRGIGR